MKVSRMGQRDQLVIEMDQGEDFAAQLYWCDESGDPYTITYPCQMDVRDAAGSLVTRFYAIADNSVTNSTFDTDTAGATPSTWAAGSNSAIQASTTTSYTGANSMRVAATTGAVAQAYNSNKVCVVSPGRTYTASAYVKGTARPSQITIDWYTSTDAVAGTSSSGTAVNNLTTGWTLITSSGIAPATAAYAKITIQFSSLTGATDYQYVDSVKFEIGGVCTNIPTVGVSLLKISSTAKGYMQLYTPSSITKTITPGTYAFDLFATTSTTSGYFTGNLQTSKICSGYVSVNSKLTDMG